MTPSFYTCFQSKPKVSPSGYYDWQSRRTAPGPRAVANQTLTQEIQAIHARSRQTYGSPRILVELRKQGHGCGRNRVARIMHETGLCGRQKGRFPVRAKINAWRRAEISAMRACSCICRSPRGCSETDPTRYGRSPFRARPMNNWRGSECFAPSCESLLFRLFCFFALRSSAINCH